MLSTKFEFLIRSFSFKQVFYADLKFSVKTCLESTVNSSFCDCLVLHFFQFGHTALFEAASNDHVEIVDFLLKAGADIDATNDVYD